MRRDPDVSLSELPGDIYDSRFLALIDDYAGAPIEAIWHSYWENIGATWCLLNSDNESEETSRIPYRAHLSSRNFYAALEATQAGMYGVLVHVGERSGHFVRVRGLGKGGITYFDPWPGRSLLAEGNNSFGVQAHRSEVDPDLWTVTRDEFDRVAYAAFVQPSAWFRANGVPVQKTYDELLKSDFFEFFRVTEAGRMTEDGLVTIVAHPGNWQDSIQMYFELEPRGSLRRSSLVVDRSWFDDPSTTLFGLDLVKSFICDLTPESDRDESRLLQTALESFGHHDFTALSSGPAHLVDQMRMAVLAVVGQAGMGRVALACTTIRILNGRVEGDDAQDSTEGTPPNEAQLVVQVSYAGREGGFLEEDLLTGYGMDDLRRSLQRKNQARAASVARRPDLRTPSDDSWPLWQLAD